MRLFVLLFILIISSCEVEVAEKLGPDGSWWLGGDDGGAFISVQDDANPTDRFYQGVIYYDSNKEVWYKGRFELRGDIKFLPDNHTQYRFWDGEKLHLQESSYLLPTDSFPQP
ncbi:MAG TPA: hypothetical protein VN030_06120 [Cellvibrio sp.]|nr:hypothetical protein [Cellvibrio sp.]